MKSSDIAAFQGDLSAGVLRARMDPMLAKIADMLPDHPGFQFEPKWDGFRALVFRTKDGVTLQSRDLKPLNRYFPELENPLAEPLPAGCIPDGEIVIATPTGLDFGALQQRPHPAALRVARLSVETPASFVAFDLLAIDGESALATCQSDRRRLLEALLVDAAPPLYLTPATTDRAVAADWLEQFEGAGLDGVVAKLEAAEYQPGKCAMLKVKHVRSAECVVAGFRFYKDSTDAVGLAAARPLRRRHDPASRRHHVVVQDGSSAGTSSAASTTSRGGAARSPLGRGDRRQCWASRPKPLESRQRSELVNRCVPNASAKFATTIYRATAFGTRQPSCAGGPTSRSSNAATTNSRRRRPTSSR